MVRSVYFDTLTEKVAHSPGYLLGRYTIYKDHITLSDYEIHDGMSLEMY